MSFLDDIIGIGKQAFGYLRGEGLGPTIARTALTGLAINQLTKSMNKANTPTQAEQSTIVTVNPNTENSIPVVYGRAIVGGQIVDARLSDGNDRMYYCLVLSERTGTLLSTSAQSVITFEEIYWNNAKVTFQSDGITAASTIAEDNYVDQSISGLVKFYLYNNGSATQVAPNGSTLTTNRTAFSVMPEWTSNHTMNELVFAIIEVTYSPTNNITGLQDLQFKLKNTMTQPGDVLYDYMTNTRYGAGIPAAEINS